jgi:hypothetical protein
MRCIYLGVSSLHIAIDTVEQGREESPEPALTEDSNPEQDQGKPRAKECAGDFKVVAPVCVD